MGAPPRARHHADDGRQHRRGALGSLRRDRVVADLRARDHRERVALRVEAAMVTERESRACSSSAHTTRRGARWRRPSSAGTVGTVSRRVARDSTRLTCTHSPAACWRKSASGRASRPRRKEVNSDGEEERVALSGVRRVPGRRSRRTRGAHRRGRQPGEANLTSPVRTAKKLFRESSC